MLIQFYNPKSLRYLIADTDAMTNSRWYKSYDEALVHINDSILHVTGSDYSPSELKRRFPDYTITEITPSTQPYEFW